MLPSDDLIRCTTVASDEWNQKTREELGVILTQEGITIEDFMNFLKRNPLNTPPEHKPLPGETSVPPPDPAMQMIVGALINGAFNRRFMEFADDVAKNSWIRKRSEEIARNKE